MTHCAKCGAELIGMKKFCATCGAPTTDPRAPSPQAAAIPAAPPSSPSPGAIAGRDSAYGAPPASVNPFAQTATPGSVVAGDYAPPASKPEPSVGQVSPLAVSNVLSQRGAFDAAVGGAVAAAQLAKQQAQQQPPPPEPPKKIPGTQIMPSVANPASAIVPSGAVPSGPPAPSAAKPRTQVMPSSVAVPGSASKIPAAAPASQIARPPAPSVPSPGVPFKPQSAPPAAAYGQPPLPQYAPPPPPTNAPIPTPSAPSQAWSGGGWTGVPPTAQPYPAPPPPPPSFAYAPGARVQVQWANGHRYPATVQQVAGPQVLVMFPDGRTQWVEMTFLSPG